MTYDIRPPCHVKASHDGYLHDYLPTVYLGPPPPVLYPLVESLQAKPAREKAVRGGDDVDGSLQPGGEVDHDDAHMLHADKLQDTD